MDAELARIAAGQGGIFLRHQALDAGYSTDEVAQALRQDEWRKIRRGAYAESRLVTGLGPAARHVLTVRAAVLQLKGRVVVTGYSALAVRNVPLWGVDLSEVHVHREGGKTSRREAGVAHHVGTLEDADIVEVDGLLVTRSELSAFATCRVTSFDAAVVLVDGLRRRHPFDVAAALALIERHRDVTGSIRAARVLRFSTDRADTVGESRARILMARIGLPAPQLQHHVRDGSGRLLGISDFFLEDRGTVAEFDGKVKYGRELYEASGDLVDVDLGDVVWREKRREDAIRDQGLEVVRMVWSELDGQDRTVAERFSRAFRRSGRTRSAG